MNKKSLRKIYLEKRKSEDIGESKKVFERLITQEEFKKAENIFCYVSFGNEIDTHEFIIYSLKVGKNIIIPYCLFDKKIMIGCQIHDLYKDTIKNSFGILEPINKEKFNENDIELVIAPGLAFSKDGTRLGFGGGYYDKFLAKISNVTVFGLTYDSLVAEHLPHFKHDIKMNKIITPRKEIVIQ